MTGEEVASTGTKRDARGKRSRWEGKAALAAPILLALAIPALVLPVLLAKSMTSDEYVHVAAGALTLSTGSFRPNWEQPPLVKLLSAWPLRLAGVVSEEADPEESTEVREAYRKFWFESPMGLDEILFRARLPTILISLALAALLFAWARSLYGPWGGVLALAAYAFSPTVLAHTGLVTMDLAGAAGFLLTLRFFWAVCRSPTLLRLALLGVSMGVALLAKFSTPLLLPALVIFLVTSLVRRKWGGGDHDLGVHRLLTRKGVGLKPALVALSVLVGSAGLTTWAGYGFETAPLSRRAKLPTNPKYAALLLTNPVLMAVYRFVGEKVPLPAPSLVRGLDRVRKHNRHGHRAFFLGERSRDGWYSYFPVAFVLKTSLPLLIILGLTGVTWWKGRAREPAVEWLLLLAAATFFLLAMSSRINIGIRHILPVYPVLCLLAGRLATVPWLTGRVGAAVLVALLTWHSVEAIRISPHYLAYFQPLSGGPARGYEKLVDSNLDWGQDLRALARDLEERGRPEVWLAYFGPLEPSTYGIRYKVLPPGEEVPGLVAISASALQLGVGLRGKEPGGGDDPYGWLRKYDPIDSVGHSILYFRVPLTE